MIPYAHLCTACHHMSSARRLVESGDLREGPYRCLHCGCEQPQNGPFDPMTKAQYEAWAPPAETQFASRSGSTPRPHTTPRGRGT